MQYNHENKKCPVATSQTYIVSISRYAVKMLPYYKKLYCRGCVYSYKVSPEAVVVIYIFGRDHECLYITLICTFDVQGV